MTKKIDYTAAEWKKLLQAPGAAGMYIMMSDPSFLIGTLKEAMAVSGSILRKEKESNSDLLAALLAEFRDREMVKEAQLKFDKKDLNSAKQAAVDTLTEAVDILDRKATPEEAAEIKAWLYEISVKVADAAKEGGFLGFGGEKVSANEKKALQELAGLLAVHPDP
jgi:predicted nucleotidyltransferase